ncbi:hypothetical protein [Vibrio phage vB_ValP_FGH]|nr:hypothetical protein [Vibrio phage vB_ValP_FGH]
MSRQTDEQMEKEILVLGLTAPRVTLDAIKSLMERVEYKVHVIEDTTTTHAVALLDGFSLAIGMSACVDPANFNEELGRKYAIIDAEEKAQKKLWELEGYRLKFSPLATTIEQIAKVAHEINAAFCLAYGDTSQPSWENAPDWQRESAINGVKFHIQNPDASPSASHDNWLKEKVADGWVYGEVKDPEAKTHPCCVEYDELPPEQKAKDYLFKQTVHSLALNG